MKLISLDYDLKTEEVKARISKSFDELPDVIKMDCIIDSINEIEHLKNELKTLRTNLSEKMYGN
jgi:hypothetical protein|tara:strand:- start:1 stop:192 length:192 start_codon:yes stop_codon:yes gene_type:complete